LSNQGEPEAGVIIVALAVTDAALADRLVALLAGVPGLRLATPGEPAQVAVVDAGAGRGSAVAEPPLTQRETEVLMLLAEGASNKMIARRLGISVHTAKFHVGQLLDKLDATGRTDAVAHAARRGVIHF
jgi:DNA-binding CsgD family transcriptional regulator